MSSLNKAIEGQITDMLQRDEEHITGQTPPTSTEIQNLLEAFVSLLNAYLQRVSDVPSGNSRVSDTFGTNT